MIERNRDCEEGGIFCRKTGGWLGWGGVRCYECSGVGESRVYETFGEVYLAGALLSVVIAVDIAGSLPQCGWQGSHSMIEWKPRSDEAQIIYVSCY